MKNDIDNVQKIFAFYGWASCPVSRKKIACLLIRGKTQEEIDNERDILEEERRLEGIRVKDIKQNIRLYE